MSGTTIAAIVPVRNRLPMVLEALDSIAAQTRPPDLLVVVDDGSTDDTPSGVRHWIDHRGTRLRSRLVRQEHRGPAAARNHGARECSGATLLAFLDSDDLWPSDVLARFEVPFARDPRVVAASCDLSLVDVAVGRSRKASRRALAGDATAWLLRHGPAGTPNTVFRAATFASLGGYDPSLGYAEDYHLMLRASLRGGWAHVPGAPVTVRRDWSEPGEPASRLSRDTADRRWIVAHMLQRFLDEEAGREAIPRRTWGPPLARRWYRAGLQRIAVGRDRDAAECFLRATNADPWHVRARLRRLRWRLPTR